MARQPEVHVRKVNQNCHVRRLTPNRLHELSIARVDTRHMPHNLGDAHNRDIFGTNDPMLARLLHRNATKAGKSQVTAERAKRKDDLRSVMIPGALTRREKDQRRTHSH